MSGPTFIASAYGPTLPSGWELVATADFNGNGKPGLCALQCRTHQTAIWYLNNNVYVSGAFGPTLPVDWGLEGVADFNSDGHRDYVLFNSTYSPNSNLVSIRANVHWRRFWADHTQWVGVSGYGRL